MRAAPLILVILAGSLAGCTSFKARPLSDVTPPRRIYMQSPQPFVAQSVGAPACRVTMLSGPFAGATGDSIFIASVSDVVQAPDQPTPCTLSGRTAVAAAELRVSDGAQVRTKRLSIVKSVLAFYLIVIPVGIVVSLGAS